MFPALTVRDTARMHYHTIRRVARTTQRAPSSYTAIASPAVTPLHPLEAAAPDLSVIERVGGEIAVLSSHISAATQRLLALIAEFDQLRGWELEGQRSCAHWLALRTGIDLGAAREKVRAARCLARLPLTSAAMARGELSFSQVRALTRVAEPENEAALLELACGVTTAQLERMIRSYRKGSRADEATRERERRASRMVSVFPDEDGMYVLRGRLPPETGALLMRALEAAGDTLFRERGAMTVEDTERDAAQRRADALGLLAERALDAGFGTIAPDTPEMVVTADIAAPDTSPRPVPISGTRARRYQVVLHVDASTLQANGEPGRADLEDGTHLSRETSRRIACDASVVRITSDREGSVLNAGRSTRTISPALRRALDVRDRGCRFPGCGLRFTDAHHVQHWADGGATSLSNCLLLCAYHHTLVHEGGWRVEWWGVRPVFIDPRGQTHFDGRWQPLRLGEHAADALVVENRSRGIMPDEWTAGARWQSERDIPVDIYLRASEVT